ncbi:hypothetical protein LguiB_028213 [Lonicera macranthoides]
MTTTTPIQTSPTTTTTSAVKCLKTSDDHHQSLLPGLPDHIAQLCLSPVPPTTLSSVCRSWRRLIYSPSFPPFLSLYTLLLPTNPTDVNSDSLQFSSFDPISSTWNPLPRPPPLHLLLRHPSFISRTLPVQSVTLSGNLILLAATNQQFLAAFSSPLIFSPKFQKWDFGPPLVTPRRWCASGTSRGAVVVASGIGSHYTTDLARSVEKWDPQINQSSIHSNNRNHCRSLGKWEKMGPLKDGKFCREAIDAVGMNNKLLMVNVKGDAAKEGVVYNVLTDTWQDMPEGMLAGWKGPATAMEEEILYAIDESRGVLRKYDEERDGWEEVVEDERLRGAESMAAGGGRVCVVCSGGVGILVVDVVASPPILLVVDTPPGFEAVAVHILPRMSRPD